MKRVLAAIDFINDLVDPDGKLAGRGYRDFLREHGTMDRVEALLQQARRHAVEVIHVRVGFSPDYREHPPRSPLFAPAREHGVFTLGEWGARFHAQAAPAAGETEIVKHRVSAFHGTPLDLILRRRGIEELILCGVATDLAVQSAARDAHDRDYAVVIVGDCCAAANAADHAHALRLLSKIASVRSLAELSWEDGQPSRD